jgi:hypothetical protein
MRIKAERRADCDSNVNSRICPRTEVRPHNSWVKTFSRFQGLSKCQCHLSVICELAWSPTERATTNHFPDTTQDFCWESFSVQACTLEFERRSDCVSYCAANQRSIRPHLLRMREISG